MCVYSYVLSTECTLGSKNCGRAVLCIHMHNMCVCYSFWGTHNRTASTNCVQPAIAHRCIYICVCIFIFSYRRGRPQLYLRTMRCMWCIEVGYVSVSCMSVLRVSILSYHIYALHVCVNSYYNTKQNRIGF